MNSVVEWRAATAARTGRPDRVAQCVCVRDSVFVYMCVGWLKQAFSFNETTK